MTDTLNQNEDKKRLSGFQSVNRCPFAKSRERAPGTGKSIVGTAPKQGTYLNLQTKLMTVLSSDDSSTVELRQSSDD